jgi:hypothetical protein
MEGDSKVAITQPYGISVGQSGRIFVGNQDEHDRNILILAPAGMQTHQVGFA